MRSKPLKARPRAGSAELLEKYRGVVDAYETLVHRSGAGLAARASSTLLALGAMRASADGMALFGEGGFLVRNARWFALGDRDARWALADGPSDATRLDLDAAAAALATELLEGDGTRARAVLVREGEALWLELRVERVETAQGRLVILVAEDVTERVRSDREVARAREATIADERMRLLGELASGVAHDLNNTLHALSLRIGHLAATPLDGRQRENVEVLARICADAAERVSRLQELARRREDVPTESFDLAAVVEEAISTARTGLDERAYVRGVRYEIAAALARGVRAVGAASELRHVFVNLLLNARDAMPDGGRVRIASAVVDGRAVVTVADEGTGIRPEHLDRLFDPFFTTKGPLGMGLGLAIAQGVMRRLGGGISAANGADGGAVFTLTFPIAPASPAGEPPAPAPAMAAGHRLLVVDDDIDNLEATKYVLEDLGQDADLAASGEDALELVREGRRYDLVLCDIGMPGMNGWQVAEEIKRRAPSTRVVMITGWAQEIAPDDPKRRGVDGVLGKPLDLAHLQEALHAWLGRGAAVAR